MAVFVKFVSFLSITMLRGWLTNILSMNYVIFTFRFCTILSIVIIKASILGGIVFGY